MFLRIIITPDNLSLSAEVLGERISEILLNNECDFIHLRLPNAEEDFIREILESVRPHLRHRITLHDYYHLAEEALAGGIQLNSRNPEITSEAGGLRISKSCHNIDEIRDCDPNIFCYVTLSPIFNSISKQGYTSTFNIQELSTILPTLSIPVIALGGVTRMQFTQLESAGFSGAATLGDSANLFR